MKTSQAALKPAQLDMRRLRLLSSPTLLAEVLELRGLTRDYCHESYTPELQLVFPIAGVHYVETEGQEVLLDLNQVGFLPEGITTKDRHPAVGDATVLIVTPSRELLEEAWAATQIHADGFTNRRCHTRPNAPELQLVASRLASRSQAGHRDDASFEEVLIALVRRAAGEFTGKGVQVTSRSLALARKVRELLAACREPLTLSQIANAVGASPTYLTDAFHKVEGIPIYRYQTRLRLARALAELPGTNDITALALDLGFSSHSHFSSVFRAAYGLSPSSYREQTRPRIVRLAAANDRGGHSVIPLKRGAPASAKGLRPPSMPGPAPSAAARVGSKLA